MGGIPKFAPKILAPTPPIVNASSLSLNNVQQLSCSLLKYPCVPSDLPLCLKGLLAQYHEEIVKINLSWSVNKVFSYNLYTFIINIFLALILCIMPIYQVHILVEWCPELSVLQLSAK